MLFIPIAAAFNLTGTDWAWQELPLQTPLTLNYTSFPAGFATEDELVDGIEESLDIWNHVGADFRARFEAEPEGHAIEVRYFNAVGGGAVAQAAMGGVPGRTETCEIRIYGQNGSGTIDWYFGPAEDIGPAQSDFVSAFLHEAGHCFGLDHSAAPGSVMAPAGLGGTTYREPVQDDIDGMLAMYGVDTRPPTPTPDTGTPDDEDDEKGCATARVAAWPWRRR